VRFYIHTELLRSNVNKYCTVEFATVGQTDDGKIYHKLWSADAIDDLLKANDLAKAEDAGEQ
jgi:hypothetical protein